MRYVHSSEDFSDAQIVQYAQAWNEKLAPYIDEKTSVQRADDENGLGAFIPLCGVPGFEDIGSLWTWVPLDDLADNTEPEQEGPA